VAQFSNLARYLSDSFRVLVPHMPGYGRTPRLGGASDALALGCRRLSDDLQELGVDDCAIVGISGGAYRGLWLALEGRMRVRTLISLAGFADLPLEQRAGLRALAAALRCGVDVSEPATNAMLSPTFAATAEGRAWVTSWLAAIAPEALAEDLEACAACADLRPLLCALPTRVVARAGGADAAMPLARSEELIAAVPHGKFECIPGLGHSQLYEDEAGTIAFIERALKPG
jgi:pimeloyl-ACP methyl ester carboxylesterase